MLATFTTPLPIRKVTPPDPATFVEKPDAECSAEELYLKGRKADCATDRPAARAYYEKALQKDAGHLLALRSLAVLDMEAGLYEPAIARLKKAVSRDADDGLSWYFLGVCHLKTDNPLEALPCGDRAVRCRGTASLGYDLTGRARMRLWEYRRATDAFRAAVRIAPEDLQAKHHLLSALYASGETPVALVDGLSFLRQAPADLFPRAIAALDGKTAMEAFARVARELAGEDEFVLLETSLTFAELGLKGAAAGLLEAACVEAVPKSRRSPLPLYYLAYYASLGGNEKTARGYLDRAAKIHRDFVFPSRVETIDVLRYAVRQSPRDAAARLHLGNLLANLGRLDEAAVYWKQAAELKPPPSVALRNLGLYHLARKQDVGAAVAFYRKAIAARPDDQTLYRDLAEILIADDKRPEAIRVLETMPHEKIRRADVIILLAQAYLDEKRYGDAIDLLESTPYFVNWEGQDVTWVIFNRAHIERGRQRLDDGQLKAALKDFEAALSYPENLGVGRSNTPEEAPAYYFKGKALQAMGRNKEARAAWQSGAAGREGSARQNDYRRRCREAAAGQR